MLILISRCQKTWFTQKLEPLWLRGAEGKKGRGDEGEDLATGSASFLILRMQVSCGSLMGKPNLQLPAQPCKTHFASTKTKMAAIIMITTTYYYVRCNIASFQSCPWMSKLPVTKRARGCPPILSGVPAHSNGRWCWGRRRCASIPGVSEAKLNSTSSCWCWGNQNQGCRALRTAGIGLCSYDGWFYVSIWLG